MRFSSRRDVLVNTVAVISATAVLPLLSGSADATDNTPVTHQVEIRKFKFFPERVEAKPGDTINWTNLDIAPHTATANDKSWDTGTLKKGESKSLLVTKDMRPDYFCRFHPHMKAGIELQALKTD